MFLIITKQKYKIHHFDKFDCSSVEIRYKFTINYNSNAILPGTVGGRKIRIPPTDLTSTNRSFFPGQDF